MTFLFKVMDEEEMLCKHACRPYCLFSLPLSLQFSFASSALFLTHTELLKVNSLHCCQVSAVHMWTFWWAHTHLHAHTYIMCAQTCVLSVCFISSFGPSFLSTLHVLLAVTGEVSILLCYCALSVWSCCCCLCVWWVYVCVLSPGQSGEWDPRL